MRHAFSAFLLVAASSAALAQGQPAAQAQTSGPILTIEEAVQLALRNNPTHLSQLSSRSRAGTSVRSAYGSFLPNVSSSFGAQFREGGTEVFGGQQFGASSDRLLSSYNISISAGYSVSSLLEPRRAKANLNAAEADVTASAAETRFQVVNQYLNVLQAQAQAALQDTLLANAQAQLELNRAREQVGAATSLQVRQAEVQVGIQRVAVLRQRNTVENAILVLFQQMGVDRMEGVRLVTTFPMSEPTVRLPELLAMARSANPGLLAAEARQQSADVSVRQARGAWFPTLGFSTGFSGNSFSDTNIEPAIASAALSTEAQRRSCFTSDSIRVGAGLAARGCDQFVFTDADAAAIRAANEAFPFKFDKNPLSYSVQVSLPIFNGFRREADIQNASLARNDARYALRARQLQINTDVTTAYQNLQTQYQTVQLQELTRVAAQQALDLANERYRVGASTFVEVSQARSDFERESTNLINAIFQFHQAYAALERAVGRPLR